MPSQQLRVIVDVTFVNWPPPSASPLVRTRKSFAKRQKLFIRHVFLGTGVGGQFGTNTAYVTIILLVFLYTAATKTFTITTGFPLGLENLEKWEGIFQSGKSQGILNRLEKSGESQGKSHKILENSGNLR